MTGSAWQVFEMPDLMKKVEGTEPRFFEFLRIPTLSSAIYRLPAGAKDMQAPHLEDEVYVVIEGRAQLRIDGKDNDIRRGSILFVQATAGEQGRDMLPDYPGQVEDFYWLSDSEIAYIASRGVWTEYASASNFRGVKLNLVIRPHRGGVINIQVGSPVMAGCAWQCRETKNGVNQGFL